jgi:hypothetical protein
MRFPINARVEQPGGTPDHRAAASGTRCRAAEFRPTLSRLNWRMVVNLREHLYLRRFEHLLQVSAAHPAELPDLAETGMRVVKGADQFPPIGRRSDRGSQIRTVESLSSGQLEIWRLLVLWHWHQRPSTWQRTNRRRGR